MRSPKRTRRRVIVGGVVALLALIIAGSMLIPDYGDNRAEAGSMPQQAINKIAQKNDNAAINAAAAMRARSAREARLADQIQDQADRANEAQPAH